MSVEFRQRTPGEYAKIAWKRKWLIILPAIAVAVAVSWSSYFCELLRGLGLDVPGALAGLQVLRKDCLARNDQLGAADIDDRIARIRRG